MICIYCGGFDAEREEVYSQIDKGQKPELISICSSCAIEHYESCPNCGRLHENYLVGFECPCGDNK